MGYELSRNLTHFHIARDVRRGKRTNALICIRNLLIAQFLLGFTSDVAFSSVTITNSGGGLALDNFDFAASATPEPGSLVLAGLALAGLAVVGRKRR